MANQEQLEILKQGVDVWNQWRKENTQVAIELKGIDLEGAFLSNIDFSSAYLQNANLHGANLEFSTLWGTSFKEADLSTASLAAAILTKADLAKANLNRASLRYASLWKADLTKADLLKADLIGANLTEANFFKANLLEANLSKVNLTQTMLQEADLTGTKLTEAKLMGANLENCSMQRTILAENDLGFTFGLEKIQHFGPSTIGTNTIRLSRGKIPIEFLRGCGLSDLDIEYAKLANIELSEKEIIDITYKIHDLRSGGISFHYNSVFISYSFKDQEFATRLYNDLQNSGVRCWFAPHDIQGGKKIHEQIDAAIRTHDRLLLIISENSMHSEWVKTEIANARQKEIEEKRQVLFPISLIDYQVIRAWKNFDADTGKDSAREIREYFIPDFSNWQNPSAYEPSFQRLLQDLKA